MTLGMKKVALSIIWHGLAWTVPTQFNYSPHDGGGQVDQNTKEMTQVEESHSALYESAYMSLQQLLASGRVVVNQTRVGRHVKHGAALSVAQVDDAARQRRVEAERPAQRLGARRRR